MRELSVAFETSDTMRVLVLSALLACVSAAPSHLVPIGLAALPVAALPVAVPTVPSGDLQAALIDAQVKINDQAQELVDQARARAELVVENQNEGVPEANDLVKEKSEEAFWAAEEKKWQALNEAQVAAAKLDASVSSNIAAYKDAQVFPYAAIGSPMIAAVVPNAAGASAVSSGEEKADVKSADASEVKSAEGEVKSEAISEIKSEDKESVEVKHNNRVKEIEDVERAEEEEIMQPQNARVQEGCDIAKEKYKEAFWALEEKKFQALSNTPIGATTVDTPTTTLLVPNVDYIGENDKNNYKNLDALDVMISDVANNNKERVECISADLMSEVANTNETTIEINISNAERSERSSAYKEPIIDELVKLGDEIQKSVDLAQELLIKLEEKLRQRKLKDKELARRKSEEDAFAADKKKWQSPSEDQLSVASSSTRDMDGRIMSQTFSPIIVEKQISRVTPDTDDPEVTEPSNSEKL